MFFTDLTDQRCGCSLVHRNFAAELSCCSATCRFRLESAIASTGQKARLSLCQRERTKVRVSTSIAPAAQTRLLARRCRVPGEPDDSRTAAQRFPCEPEIPTEFDLEFVRHDSYGHHRPIRSRALRSDNRNPGCNGRMDADSEICSLQNFGSANAAKECAQCRFPSCVTNEHDSRRIILVTNAIFEKQDYPHLNPLSAKRGEADEGVHAGVFAFVTCSSPLPLAKGED
jgi:hypothetical protein